MTHDEISEIAAPGIILKFVAVPEGMSIHASFQGVTVELLAVAIDYLTKEAHKLLLLSIAEGTMN